MASVRSAVAMPDRPAPIPVPVADVEAAREQVVAHSAAVIRRLVASDPVPAPPPVDPHQVAALLGLTVRHTRASSGWDAMLVPLGPRPLILCNLACTSERRRRFSIAHEVAHTFFANAAATYQLRTRARDAYATSAASRELERLVDLGAAELLMPGPWFAAALAATGVRAMAVATLAERFRVSLTAAARRLVETAPEPCVAGFFGLERPASTGGRAAYRALPGRVFRSPGLPLVLPAGKSVPASSVIHRCSLRPGELEAEEELRLGATTWRARVTALPLHRRSGVDGPPVVCAVLVATA